MNNRPRILIVDDDQGIATLLRDYLAQFRLDADFAEHGDAMHAKLASGPWHLVVMDVMLPGRDGFTLARELRTRWPALPIIMLTARGDTHDRIIGLENGADDYITKPFEPRELVARIHTVLRRIAVDESSAAPQGFEPRVHFDGWELDRNARELTTPAGMHVALSNAEYRLLLAFLETPRRLRSRDQLMERARGRSMDSFDRSIDLLVSRLRQKLASEPGGEEIIRTVRGAGYVFAAQDVRPLGA